MTIWLYVGFIGLVCVLLALDLGVFHRKAHVVKTKEALAWTVLWILCALVFNVFVYYAYEHHIFGIGLPVPDANVTGKLPHDGKEAALFFLTGYLVEKSLSLDNIFVIALIFAYFKVPGIHQHRVLFWGILGALVMRGVMIYAGAKLVESFSWVMYVFGGLLLFTAAKMLFAGDATIHPEKSPLLRVARKIYPVTRDFEGQKFFTKLDGKRAITPLFLVLLLIESTDVIFAVDSIPAIFGITTDPFIVFTSNIFAILGLRTLYFVLAAMMDVFHHLKFSLVFVLAFVGVKMIAEQAHFFHITPVMSLCIIGGALGLGMIASLMHRPKVDEVVAGNDPGGPAPS